MAQGDMIIFDQAYLDIGKGSGGPWDMTADTFNMALVDNTTVPTRDTAAPHYGGTGTTNFATNAVATATAWTGPVALSGLSWSEAVADTFRLDFTDPATIAQDAGGFTNGYWAILYNATDINKRALCAIDLGGPVSLVAGPLDINFNALGIFQVT